MKNLEALQILQQAGKKVFSVPELKNILGIKKDNTLYKKVGSLIKDGALKRAMKGTYFLPSSPPSDFGMANHLCQPSYVSLASALNYHGILVQVPYEVTSVTPKLTRKTEVEGKIFVYSHLDEKYFWGYEKEESFLIALPEKALVDALFLISLGKLSLNYDEFILDRIDKRRLKDFVKKIDHPAFHKFVRRINL